MDRDKINIDKRLIEETSKALEPILFENGSFFKNADCRF